jgi:hypothetical protein
VARRSRAPRLQLVIGTMLVMVVVRRSVWWLQNDLIKSVLRRGRESDSAAMTNSNVSINRAITARSKTRTAHWA